MTSGGLHTTLKTCLLLKRESDSSGSRFSLAKNKTAGAANSCGFLYLKNPLSDIRIITP